MCAFSIRNVSTGKINKQKGEKKVKKRSGNNLYGSKGKHKCQTCRKKRRPCLYGSPDSPCELCLRSGQPCGEKTRRGGPQDTVRITVLEKVREDHPDWTLADAIAYLKGRYDRNERSQSVDTFHSSAVSESSDESGTLHSQGFAEDEDEEDDGETDLITTTDDPLKMELSLPDETHVFKKESVSDVSTMASPHQPTLVYPDEFAITIPFGTPANWSSVYAHYKPEDDHDAQQFYTQAMDNFDMGDGEISWSVPIQQLQNISGASWMSSGRTLE